ncbi:MAG: hypothetical protein HY273_09060 [Gammaproteobacteria bacterium]|nr:hypothetical protein [Gammaproteobacteria bacterium]
MRYSRYFVLCVVLAWAVAALAAPIDELRAHYRELTENVATNPFGMPLGVQSSEQGDKVSAEVYGVVDQAFSVVAEILGDARAWCGFMLLSVNVKSCALETGAAGSALVLYIGRKDYQTPQQAYEMRYVFRSTRDAQHAEIYLDADGGPLGTRDNHIHLDALAVDGRTLVHFTSSMRLGTVSRMATATYLATLGSGKIGFSSMPDASGKPVPVKGVQAMIERNVVRYFLALQIYVDTRALTESERFEQQINRWFDYTERFHAQLYELPKAEYLANKRRERDNQVALQRRLDNPKAQP